MTFVKTLWVDRSLTTRLTAAQLNRMEQGIDDAHTGIALPLVAALPGAPVDGQQVLYLADEPNGVVWHLRYRAMKADGTTPNASAYKWEMVGGPPLTHNVDTEETATATAPADLATVGPLVTVPLAGDYVFTGSADMYGNSGTVQTIVVNLVIAGVSTRSGIMRNAANLGGGMSGRTIRRNGIASGSVCKLQYWSTVAVSFGVGNRSLAAAPVRVG